MKALLSILAAGIFLVATNAHATGFINPVTTAVAGTAVKNVARSNAEQLAILKGQNHAGGGSSDATTNNDTDVDSLGLAFSFPPPAIGNGAHGSWAAGWGFVTSTFLEEEALDANTVSNVTMFYAETDDPVKADTLKKVLASYMCASERQNVRAGGGLLFGDFGYSGCMTAAE